MSADRYLALTGGIGGAKLALGLSKLLDAREFALAVNTADDFEHLGLHISPDIDTLVYTLADECNPETGWGRRNDTWHFLTALADLGGETWFKLGDKDLAMSVARTAQLRSGETLSHITGNLSRALGVRHPILPMTDDTVRTFVHTDIGKLALQHYFVREGCAPAVRAVEYTGADNARANPAIIDWLDSERLAGIVICSSSPLLSIDPILAVPGLREQLRCCGVPVIAVSPIVGGAAVKGPLAKMLGEMSIPASASWIAEHYGDILDGFVIDDADAGLKPDIEALGIVTMTTNTIMKTLDDRVNLARGCLELVRQLERSRRCKAGAAR